MLLKLPHAGHSAGQVRRRESKAYANAPGNIPRYAIAPLPEARAVCSNSASADLCGGRGVTVVPTATFPIHPVAQMGFVITALFGALFLGEPFTARKGAGLAAALAALASLASG